ncbi:MAG: hypothetical protein JKX84_02685 [Flavobacteriales bacterium]|nr:hypothetical protein [Flavobacteriales bacterium]
MALVDQEPCELLYQSQLLDYLNEQFNEISFSPSISTVKNVLDYSKAVNVKKSKTMIGGHVIVLN